MRIISQFHDYYDSVMTHGADDTCIFKRTPREMALKNMPDSVVEVFNEGKYIGLQASVKKTDYTITGVVVLFGGLVYRGARVIKSTFKKIGVNDMEDQVFYTIDSLNDYLTSNGVFLEKIHSMSFGARVFNWARPLSKQVYKNFERFLGRQGTNELYQFCLENQIPLATYECSTRYDLRNPHFCINGSLKRFNFVKVKDPYTAYQELDMYISGVMNSYSPEMPKEEIADEDRLFAHGFDQYSFRKRR